MSKIRLCSKDEGNLVEQLKAFSEQLEDCGIEGVAEVTFSSNGDISGKFSVNVDTVLLVDVEEDGDKKTLEYRYV